jgi:hypothetical protein
MKKMSVFSMTGNGTGKHIVVKIPLDGQNPRKSALFVYIK